MKVRGCSYTHVFTGRLEIKKGKGKFMIRNLEKQFGDCFHITLYAIHGFSPVYFDRREKNSIYVSCDKETTLAGYQILGFPKKKFLEMMQQRGINSIYPFTTPLSRDKEETNETKEKNTNNRG